MSITMRRGAHQWRLLAGACTLALPLALAACAEGGSSASGASGDCGTIPKIAPKDPAGVLDELPTDMAAAYNGYAHEVQPSAWADWKPSGPGPYEVGILWPPPTNPGIVQQLEEMTAALEASGIVKIVSSVAPKDPTDIPGSLQLFNQLVAQKPDMIIMMPLAADPFVDAVDAAGKAGIPVVTPWLPVPSKYAIGVGNNHFQTGATLAAKIASDLGGKGNVMLVHGIPGIAIDTDTFAGVEAALELCPDIKVVGEVTGNFNTAATKQAVLQFLSTHPEQIDAVFQPGVMAVGAVQAFEQLGRPAPKVTDPGATHQSIAYAHENASTFDEYGTSYSIDHLSKAFAESALRTLRGEGPVVNHMIVEPAWIYSEDVDSVYQDGWAIGDEAGAALPDDEFMSTEQFDAFFGVAK